MTSQPIRQPVRILGIDPGLRRTGWGVVEADGNRLSFIGCGSVEPEGDLPLSRRLLAIHEGLAAVLGDFRPAEAAVEQTFVNKDGVATLKLGVLGPVYGWPFFMSLIVIVSTAIGILAGEWNNAMKSAVGLQFAGVGVLTAAVIVLSYTGRHL